MNITEMLKNLRPQLEDANVALPEDPEELDFELLSAVIRISTRIEAGAPYEFEGMTREELEDLRQQTEEQIDELAEKLEAIEDALDEME